MFKKNVFLIGQKGWLYFVFILALTCFWYLQANNFVESEREIDEDVVVLNNILNLINKVEDKERQVIIVTECAKKMEEERDEAQRELANVERCLQIKRQKKAEQEREQYC